MPELDALIDHSIRLIASHQASTGAYPASPSFPNYRYSWFRDGAFIAEAMSRAGEVASADAFFDWCAGVIRERRGQVESLIARAQAGIAVPPDQHLHTRYTVDGRESEEPWETFQLDGYGTWLWALDSHARRHGVDPARHVDELRLLVRYLATFWAEPSYDWWEEHVAHRHTSTLAAIRAGLHAAGSWSFLDDEVVLAAREAVAGIDRLVAGDAVIGGSLTKWLGSDAVDASLVACFVPFGLYPPGDPVATATIGRIESELAPAGVYRYLDDEYYGGGQWVLLAGFLGWYHAAAGNSPRATALLEWVVGQADEHGDLPEQVAVDLLHPDREAAWIARWGPSAKPLLWSHAMLLILADSLGHRIGRTDTAAIETAG